jgi:hypothetical protein
MLLPVRAIVIVKNIDSAKKAYAVLKDVVEFGVYSGRFFTSRLEYFTK